MAKPQKYLIQQIKEKRHNYSRAFKQLADLVLEQTFAVSSMGIDELAQAANVSVATVNRFAHSCGYSGYPQFRADLRKIFDKVFEPANKIRSDTLKDVKKNDIAHLSLDASINNMKLTQELLKEPNFKKAIRAILTAKNIYISGMGVSMLHASFMEGCLESFLPNRVRDINGFCGSERAFKRVSTINPKDLLIVIALPRYSKGIVDIVHMARERKCKILALTDAYSSPIVPLVDIALFAPSEHPVLYATNAPIISLIEAISSVIALQVTQSAEYVELQTEKILQYFYLPTDEKSNQ